MGARTGQQFLDGLAARPREIWLGRERVADVTKHPSLTGAAHALAAVFDRQHEHADDCLMTDQPTGESVNVSHMIPRSVEDLRRRHRGLRKIAEMSVGIMGRTPDYMNVTFAGFAGERTAWIGPNKENEEGHANLVAFQRELALQDISLTHTIVHATIDRANDMKFANNPVPLHKVGETADSVVVRGARILATLAPFADEIAVYPGMPLPPDASPDYALSFSIGMETPGLIFLCRDSAAAAEDNGFDHPLSSRFDEQDAFVIFDDVEVPKHRMFIDSKPDVYSSVMGPTAWWANIMQQTTIRAHTKLEFAYGLATRLAESVNDVSPQTAEMLGELASYAEVARSSILLSEDRGYDRGDGVVFPDGRPLHPMRSLLAVWYPRVREILMLIGSHNLIAAPSRTMLDDERLRPLIDRYMHGANDQAAERRAALHRLAWDFIGSGLGSRNELYERNYLGSAKTNRTHLHAMYADRSDAFRLVDEILESAKGIA